MGFCCGGASKTTLQEPRIPPIKKIPSGASAKLDNQLIVYGDYFQSETRTIITVLEYTKCKYSFNPIDVFQGENENEEFLKINPLGQVPMIKDKDTLVIGNYSSQLQYIIKSFKLSNSKMSQLIPDDQEAQIQMHLLWFQSIFRPCTQRFLKNKFSRESAFEPPAATNLQLSQIIDEFQNKILPQINKALGTNMVQKYILRGIKEMSLIDILYYNEVQTFLKLEISSKTL